MKTPNKELNAVKAFLQTAQRKIAEGAWEEAEKAAREALRLDENHAAPYLVMGEVLEAQGKAAEAGEWRDKAERVRKEAWQKQVEAEARGHHEVLGTPGRHEIP